MKPAYTGGQGICSFSRLTEYMSEDAVKKAAALCPEPKSVLFFLFPYLSCGEGNLSIYARGRDYHKVIADTLEPLAAHMRETHPSHHFIVLADDSPLPEVMGAWLSGAGTLGRNGLIFDRVYGSYVFIGTILTSLLLTPTAGGQKCSGCLKCVRACPYGALDEIGFHKDRCLSYLTQKGGAPSAFESEALERTACIWGCDICSDVCPMNAAADQTPNPAFRENLITSLTLQDTDNLTRREFAAKYPDRAFTWKGPAPIVRNLKLKNGKHSSKAL